MALVKTVLDKLTYRVNGIAMGVQNELKPGHRERIYQQRLYQRLLSEGIHTDLEKHVEVYINDGLVGYMFLDLWVENALVVECKAHNYPFSKDEIGQVIAYLAATGSPVGLLYNFGTRKLTIQRILPPTNVQEWHKHLYRCIWVPHGNSLPSLDELKPDIPIRFSVVSPYGQTTSRLKSEIAAVRLSIPTSAEEASSVTIPLSDSTTTEEVSSDTVRLSAPASAEEALPASYAGSGVSIDAGNQAVSLMRSAVKSTYGPEILMGIGAFGGLYDAAGLKGMRAPVLVSSTDGVGTKVKLAAQAGRYRTIGQDIVNHCINDILVQGARPLFFLDYFATSKLRPEITAEVVTGIAEACRQAGCALIGGETAEMPGVYSPDEFDLAGTIVGVVEKEAILPRTADIREGDALIGLCSSGPHTNGFSLIRKIFADVSLDTVFPELGIPLADALLVPHRSYLALIQSVIIHLQSTILNPQSSIKALMHLTGGGFIENIPRVLPEGVNAVIQLGSWPIPPLFRLIQQRGGIATEEMFRVFNMGIGMVIVAARDQAASLQAAIPEETWVIGEIAVGNGKVVLI